jgi:hypothetical protein
MALTKAQILALKPRTHEVQVPDWGGFVHIRALTVHSMTRFMEQREKLSPYAQSALLVAASICDEEGSLLFDEGDLAEIQAMGFSTIELVSKEVLVLNKLGPA